MGTRWRYHCWGGGEVNRIKLFSLMPFCIYVHALLHLHPTKLKWDLIPFPYPNRKKVGLMLIIIDKTTKVEKVFLFSSKYGQLYIEWEQGWRLKMVSPYLFVEFRNSFHFRYIGKNIKDWNHVCPICICKWKELPFQFDTDVNVGRHRTQYFIMLTSIIFYQ